MKKMMIFLYTALLCISCQENEPELSALLSPLNLEVSTDISMDGSGIIHFLAVAENAISYKYTFTDGTTAVASNGKTTKRFTKTGVNTYGVIVVAYGSGGISASKTLEVTVESDFSDPEAIQLLTAGGSKTWYWAADQPGHLGVGQNNEDAGANYYANYYEASPFEKAGEDQSSCLYEDELVFSIQGETLMYTLNNNGKTFFNASYENVVGGNAGSDNCYDFDTAGDTVVTLGPSESFVAANGVEGQTRGTVLNFTNDGFMGYYIGATSYELISLTATKMVVRAVMGNDAGLAWYHIFSSTKPTQGEESSEGVDISYTNLVWEDNFDVDGAPSATNWTYDIGGSGWGNNESQYYTNRTENVNVADGILKITAQKESYSGSAYTSARLKSQGLQEFTYGRMDVRAKLPEGGGTWPAIWMLGSSIETLGWPACGEVDIMEHVGNNQNTILSAIHTTSSNGNTVNKDTTVIEDVAGEFHVYSINWSPNQISLLVDDVIHYTYSPTTKNADTWPFDANQFIILNIAIGGTLGGAIDPAFTSSSLEVDYVKYYQ